MKHFDEINNMYDCKNSRLNVPLEYSLFHEIFALPNSSKCQSLKQQPEHAPFASVVKQLLVLDPRKRCQAIPDLMDTIRAIADSCSNELNPSDPISPVPVRKAATPPPMESPSAEQAPDGGFGQSLSQSDLASQVIYY